MASTTYRYGLLGIGSNVQVGRRGGHLSWNGSEFRLFEADNTTLAQVRIASTPVNDNDAASKAYVDSLIQGLSPKDSVRVATTAAGTLATSFEDGDIIDGVTLSTGDRVLIKDQSAPAENGIYVVQASGAPVRADDANSSTEIGSAFIFVQEGSTHANQGWVTSFNDSDTIDVDAINWIQFSAAGAFTASTGVQLVGTDFQLDINGLSNVATVATDEIAVFDVSGTSPVKRQIGEFVTDHGIITTSNLASATTGGVGIDITGTTISFDNSGMADTAIVSTDSIPFFDASNSGQAEFRTVSDFLTDLDIISSSTLGGNGIAVQTATGTFAARSIAVDGAGALDGLVIANGDGVSGNPTIGLDIQNLPVRSDVVDVTDRVAVYNVSTAANEYYTVGELAGAVASTNSFSTWTAGGNTTGDANIVADSSSDTATLTGGDGINIAVTTASDTLEVQFTRAGMVNTATTGSDTVPFFDASASNTPEFRSFSDLITDQDIRTGTVGVTDGGTGLTTIPEFSLLVANTADTLSAVAATDTGGNQLLQWNDTSNLFEFITTASITGSDSYGIFELSGGNNTGDATISASAAPDTLNLSGGTAISLAGSSAGDSITISLTDDGLVSTAVVGTDTVPFFDASATGAPALRSFTNILADLNIVTAAADGILVRTAADTYASRTIAASSTAGDQGLVVANGDGVSGDPTVALDIDGLTANSAASSTDEFVVFDGTNNRKVTLDAVTTAVSDASNGVRVIESAIGTTDAASIGTLPSGARILRMRVYIDVAYDNSADVQINGATAGDLMDETDIDALQTGTYETDIDYRNTGANEAITLQLVNGTPTVGSGRVFIEYYDASV